LENIRCSQNDEKMIEHFKNYLEVERNVSEHTRIAYLADVNEFFHYLIENNLIKEGNITAVSTEK